MNDKTIEILYAEDDEDDRALFQQALNEAHADAKLTTVEDGDKLMKYLAQVMRHAWATCELQTNCKK